MKLVGSYRFLYYIHCPRSRIQNITLGINVIKIKINVQGLQNVLFQSWLTSMNNGTVLKIKRVKLIYSIVTKWKMWTITFSECWKSVYVHIVEFHHNKAYYNFCIQLCILDDYYQILWHYLWVSKINNL